VLADALARAGVARVFTTGAGGPAADGAASAEALRGDAWLAPLAASAARAGLHVVGAGTVESACVMAAVTGEALGLGALLIQTRSDEPRARASLSAALAERSPLVCFGVLDAGVAPAVKAVVDAGAASAAHWIAHAIHLARTPPRGPVYVTASEGGAARAVPVATTVAPVGWPAPDPGALDAAAAAIRDAAHPAVVAGTDARSDATSSWLRAFAESVPAPVLATWKGKGALPDPHPLAFGVVAATAPAVAVLERADLVVAVGLDELERDELGWRGPVVELGPLAAPARSMAAVPGEAGTILAELAPRLSDTRADWDVAQLDRWKRQLDVRGVRGAEDLVGLVGFVREAMPGTTAAAFEASLRSGAHAWDCVTPEDLCVLARSDLAGFAVPAAVASSLARAGSVALAFTDRASLAAAGEALASASRLRAAIGVIVTGGDPEARRGLPGGHAVGGRGDDVPVHPATTAPALGAALSRLLAERRPIVIDATGMLRRPPV
jgi:acetolactate synthase-1/2/3 large subunit